MPASIPDVLPLDKKQIGDKSSHTKKLSTIPIRHATIITA